MKWHPALYEQSVVEELRKSQFHAFVERVKVCSKGEACRKLSSEISLSIPERRRIAKQNCEDYLRLDLLFI